MTIHNRFAVRAATFASFMTLSAASLAHVDLTTPNPRSHGQTSNFLKSGPCGQETNGRTADVSVFAPGQTITVTWNEYIDHPAYYRIAFDDDGDDGFAVRTDGQTDQAADNPQAVEAALNMDAQILAIVTEENDTTAGPSTDIRSVDVTLPDVTCENCTLQLIQYMYNNPAQGYFQCADIALRASEQVSATPDAGIGGEAGSANAGDAGAGGAGGSGGAPSAAGTGGAPSTGGTPSSSGGASSGAGTGSAPPPASGGSATAGEAGRPAVVAPGTGGGTVTRIDASDDDGGCTISTHSSKGQGSAGLFSLLALGLGLVARRRR